VTYTVVWKTAMLERLAQLYVEATPADRIRMAKGVESLNRRLADDPLDEGESRTGSSRMAFVPLLVVTFLVDEHSRTVRVNGDARFGR